MVRVISSGFSTPRSRHSSGEDMIDRFAAMKALSALNENEKLLIYKERYGSGNLVIDSNTDTNDSFSGADSEEEIKTKTKEKTMDEKQLNQDPAVLKKERRKERNKLSAQNYRQRRRQQASTAQKTLDALESRHKVLLEKVRHLEAEKHIVEEYLKSCVKIPWCPHHQLAKPANPPPHPPPIPENRPLTTVYSNDNMASSTTTTSAAPQNMRSDACADMNVNYTFNTMIVNTNFTATEFNNNNNINKHVPKDTFPTRMETEGNNNMPLCMTGTSSQQSSGSSVS